jgi:hypothetical protein
VITFKPFRVKRDNITLWRTSRILAGSGFLLATSQTHIKLVIFLSLNVMVHIRALPVM